MANSQEISGQNNVSKPVADLEKPDISDQESTFEIVGQYRKLSKKGALIIRYSKKLSEPPEKGLILYIEKDGNYVALGKVRKINKKKRLLLVKQESTANEEAAGLAKRTLVYQKTSLPSPEEASPSPKTEAASPVAPSTSVATPEPTIPEPFTAKSFSSLAIFSRNETFQADNVGLGIRISPKLDLRGISLKLRYPSRFPPKFLQAFSLRYLKAASPTADLVLTRAGASETERTRIKMETNSLGLCYQNNVGLEAVEAGLCLSQSQRIETFSFTESNTFPPTELSLTQDFMELELMLSYAVDQNLTLRFMTGYALTGDSEFTASNTVFLDEAVQFTTTKLQLTAQANYKILRAFSDSFVLALELDGFSKQFEYDATDLGATNLGYTGFTIGLSLEWSL